MDFSWHEAQAARMACAHQRNDAAEDSYRMLHANRMRIGLSRLSIGFHLAHLKDSGAWRGRSGSMSFHRFMIEEGLEPKSAVQYMAVARAYLIEHSIEPKSIAMASMRLLTACIPRLNADNIQEIVDLLGALPAAEARQAIEERFPLPGEVDESSRTSGRPALSRSANRILGELDGMSFDERRELYRVLHLGTAPAVPAPTATPAQANTPLELVPDRTALAANDAPPPISLSA